MAPASLESLQIDVRGDLGDLRGSWGSDSAENHRKTRPKISGQTSFGYPGQGASGRRWCTRMGGVKRVPEKGGGVDFGRGTSRRRPRAGAPESTQPFGRVLLFSGCLKKALPRQLGLRASGARPEIGPEIVDFGGSGRSRAAARPSKKVGGERTPPSFWKVSRQPGAAQTY